MAKVVVPEDKELNKPFPNDKEGFSVYTKNLSGDVVLVRFSGNPTASTSEDPSTPQYWNEKTAGIKSQFKHTAFFDMATRRVRSVRDGVQEYYGIELGIEPHNKVFTLYRSPETIANMAAKLPSIPITNEHVSANDVSDVKDSDKIGMLTATEIIELQDEATDSTLCLENTTALNDQAVALTKAGKKEFSLGYTGKLKPHDVYDFEQYEINPTHLALVDNARGGSVLTFADKKGDQMAGKKAELHKVFLDAEGAPNLQQIVEIGQGLSEALKTVPIDELKKMLPTLQKIMEMGKTGSPSEEVPAELDVPAEMSDEDMDKAKEAGKAEMMDADMEDMDEEEKKKFGDSKLFKSIVASQSKSFSDSKAFKSAVETETKRHAAVIEKATQFVDEKYVFSDKSTVQIMRDAIAAEHGDAKFEDSELSVAFKLLKRTDSSLLNFGDGSGKSALEQRIEKSMEK